MCIFAVISISVCRCPKSQWAIRIYTIVLIFWSLIFIAIAILAPSYAAKAINIVEDECGNRTSPIWVVDGVYLTSN